jgi:hypothetical protein
MTWPVGAGFAATSSRVSGGFVLGRRGIRAGGAFLARRGDLPGLGQYIGDAAQEGVERRGGDAAQDYPVQAGTQMAKRWAVGARQRYPRLILPFGGEAQVGIQSREQATHRAGRLPAQPDRLGAVPLHGAQEAHLDQLGDPGYTAKWANPDQAGEGSLIGIP